MLVLSRKEGESIEFRDLNVCVRVIQLKKSKVQLGIEAPRAIQVDRTETLARQDENERSSRQQNLSGLTRKFDQKRIQTNESEPEQRLLDELAKLEVEVMTLAELVNSKHQDLARQTALVSLERLNGVRKMLRVSSRTYSTFRSMSDFIKTKNCKSHGASSAEKTGDEIARQDCHELTPTTPSQIDSLRQSGVGYFLESDLTSFSEHRAM
ncbi:MAG: hypothetical protein CMM01_19330 [Rhodopirellula sp.]|nr:hypothetical protein [Rhodopirellula sp.]OUX49783.1 MAG: hypothetical protein CBE43_09265 [Rhodopirellula sp. TMED283]